MRKLFLIGLFSTILLLSTAIGQSNAVQITGGNFYVFSGKMSRIETSLFSATSSFPEHSESVWAGICNGGSFCRGGKTFKLPYHTRIGQNIGTSLPFVSGDFFTNGKSYQTVYYTGDLKFADSPQSEDLIVTIPKYFDLRRKGIYRIKRSFTLLPTSSLNVCEVSILNAPCPADKTVFDGTIQGHGTVTVTLRFLNANPENPQLIRKSFEYRFEQ